MSTTQMTEAQADRATELLARLLARELGLTITKLTVTRVDEAKTTT